jgi:transcriptional regulator with XRE-family HTH domain
MPSVPKKKPQPLPFSPLPIGKRIAEQRKARGLSQQALADQLCLSQKQITAYETGKAHLNDEMIVRFALALGISADEMLGLKDIEASLDSPSLRFTRRIRELEQLSEAKKKVILQVLDDLIRANS